MKQSATSGPDKSSSTRSEDQELKADISLSPMEDVPKVMWEELHVCVLSAVFHALKCKLHAVQNKIANNMATIQTEVNHMSQHAKHDGWPVDVARWCSHASSHSD